MQADCSRSPRSPPSSARPGRQRQSVSRPGSLLEEAAEALAGFSLLSGVARRLERLRTALRRHHRGQVGELLRLERSEEHTSELQSLMRISYAVFCLKKKNKHTIHNTKLHTYQTKYI